MIVRTPEERAALIEGGKRLAVILKEIEKAAIPGASTDALNTLAEKLIRDGGDIPSLIGYTPEGARRPYPATMCVAVNDEVVHGIPNENPRILKEGDIVGFDLVLTHKGLLVDATITVPIGNVDANAQKLIDTTRRALDAGIAAARVGNRIGDISHAIESVYDGTGFSIVKILGGHGVGQYVHEEPWIANTGHPGTGEELVPGMVLALEPIANEGKAAVILDQDGYTYRTKDGSRSAHFEHTILIEETGTTILTARPR